MAKEGKFLTKPTKLKRTKKLAELTGVILGDGNIHRFPRTECLTIASNAKNKGFIKRYAGIVERIFLKRPSIIKLKRNCTRIAIYQKYLSCRLGIISGDRSKKEFAIPKWILNSREYLKSYLRGLYEAEGSFCVHKPTCTYKFLFSNRNESLLRNVYNCLRILGFHPHKSKYQIQVSRRKEVYKVKDLIKFRQY